MAKSIKQVVQEHQAEIKVWLKHAKSFMEIAELLGLNANDGICVAKRWRQLNDTTHPEYVYWICYVNACNKFENAIVYVRFKLDSEENLIAFERSCLEKFARNFRAVVNYKYLKTVQMPNKEEGK